jgi:hypothetical protein
MTTSRTQQAVLDLPVGAYDLCEPGGAERLATSASLLDGGETVAQFAFDEACRRYLMACRWPGGFRCPTCGDASSYLLAARELLQCRACRRQTSVTAGTVLDRTRLPLPLWFAAAYFFLPLPSRTRNAIDGVWLGDGWTELRLEVHQGATS